MITEKIREILKEASKVAFPDLDSSNLHVKPTENSKFGDFQTEFAMASAKVLKQNPFTIAEKIVAEIKAENYFKNIEIIRPGFINFFINNSVLESKAISLLNNPTQTATSYLTGKRVVIDYSSPNVAKIMHIGHIRSTVVGNTLYNILKFSGATVISDNHIGDWGTQFGKLIVAYNRWCNREVYKKNPVSELERLYQKFEKEKDKTLEDEARNELVKLQQGDKANRELWTEFINASKVEFNKTYNALEIEFDYTLGESFYNDMLPEVVENLLEKKIATKDQNAVIIDTEKRYDIHGPIIIKKRDGGFNYATTDLASVKYRIDNWKPDSIIYVTDGRQQDHFKSIFAASREWLDYSKIDLRHVWFGSIKSKDGKSFSTRDGNVIPLHELISESIERAEKVVEEKNSTLPVKEKKNIAQIVGIGALKYAELNHDLKSDTIFDWDRMLAFEGNTAPYHLYTYARIKSVLRRYKEKFGSLPKDVKITIQNETEKNLIIQADTFPQKLKLAANELKPNLITEFVHQLAREFNSYYNRDDSPILKEENETLRSSRAAIYVLVSELIRVSLNILGIKTLERM